MDLPRAKRRAVLGALLLLLATSSLADKAEPAASEAASQSSSTEKAKPVDTSTGAGKAIKSNIVPSAGETELPYGIGDLLPDGPCKADIDAFCKGQKPGDGRLSACLSKQLQVEKKGNAAGRTVSDKCAADVANWKIERSTHINKDVALAKACQADVAQVCASLSDTKSPGSVVACLREKSKNLSQQCQKETLRTQLEAAEDYRRDPKLFAACGEAVKKLCPTAEPGEGHEMQCLAEKSKQLSWDCLDQVIRFQHEAAKDIRLDLKLFKSCVNDQRKFCKDVEPGHMRVMECLEDHLDDEAFSPGCKKNLEDAIAMRVADFRLDSTLQEACEEDLANLCMTTPAEMKDDEKKRLKAVNCLQTMKNDLKSQECRDKVHRKMMRAARDIRFDDVLAKACSEDRKQHCNNVQPGSARVIRCLQEHRSGLRQQCNAALFDHEVKMAEDIDFKYPMRKACAWEISTFCPNVPHGHARIVRCLQEKLEHEDMSKECKDEVVQDMNRAANDYRLNYRLNHACEADINHLCSGLCATGSSQPCGGVVLRCLSQKLNNITTEACQEEVFYYLLMEVSDFRNDVILAEACRTDVDKYCKDVEPGEGRVHTCLRHQLNFLSEACRIEESKLAAVEYRDIRLKPKLAKVCSEERTVYCKDVKPGKGRVIKCLTEHMAQPNFGSECRAELKERAEVMSKDYRMDIDVLDGCSEEVDTICSEAKKKLRGNSEVVKCLIDKFDKADQVCQYEVSRTVRLALWDYSSSSPLTAVCDDDVAKLCPKNTANRPGGAFTIGVAGHCLSRAAAEGKPLAPACRGLVLAAAPKDSRSYLRYPEKTGALLQQIANVQRAAGLEGVLVDPYTRTGSTITVTGWAALACIFSTIAVAIGGAVIVARRLTGADKPHTQYVKSGDA